MNNQLTSLRVSNNGVLVNLMCNNNQLTSLDVTSCTSLEILWCGLNQLGSLDLSMNSAIGSGDFVLHELDLSYMPTLYKVCVWSMPFPPEGVTISTSGSPNLSFTEDCSALSDNEIETRLPSGLQIYPNPTSGMITIEPAQLTDFDIEITSVNGQLIYNACMEGNSCQLDLSSCKAGVYFITVRGKDMVITRKFIIQ
jgi:hypothetical protein